MKASRRAAAACVLFSLALATAAVAEWLGPDATYRDAQLELRQALRDTAGHSDDAARLDTLGVALLKLARLEEAATIFRRVWALQPGDPTAAAGLGKLALFEDRLGEAESLLAPAAERREAGAIADLHAALLRRGDFVHAAERAASANQPGRAPLLLALAKSGAYRITGGPAEGRIFWTRGYPVPLVRVKLNGQSVLMALDTGSRDLLLDLWAARRAKVEPVPGESQVFWSGTQVGVRQGLVQKLEIGGFTVENLPTGILALRKWSIQVNPQQEAVAGVIGLNFLRAFLPTFDYRNRILTLRRPDAPWAPPADADRVPFQIWGEAELTVYGTIGGGRRMAMVVQSGIPECGVAAPDQVFEELGLKANAISRVVKGAGVWLAGKPWTHLIVPTVAVGPVVADKVPGWSGALDPAELWRHGVRRDAALSHDFFRERRVTYDWSRHQLVFERAK